MKLYVDLTDNELRALSECLIHSYLCCQGSCAYPEMQEKNIDCHNCKFTKGMASLKDKLYNMKSLVDYTKQVRKEICDKIRENAISHNNLEVDMYYITPQQLYEIEKGETNG